MSTSATGFRGVFGIDVRSLALWRIGLGLLVLFDAVDRLRVLAHLTGDGVLPLSLVPARRQHWSVLFWNDTPAAVVAVLVVLGLAGAAIAVGWRTRWAALLAWALIVSIHGRNPHMLYGGDALLRLMLFWSLFLPTNALLSLDARAGRTRTIPATTVISAGSVGYLLQIGAEYVVTGLLKSGRPWHDGTALHDALHVDQFLDPLGRLLQDEDWLTVPLTHWTYWLEVVGPFFLLVPFAFGPFRTFVVAQFLLLHLGIEAMMDLGMFPTTSMVCWIPLLPGWLWDRLRWPLADGGRDPFLWWSWIWQAVAAWAAVMVVWWNVGAIQPAWQPVQPFRRPAMMLRLDQYWDMFAPKPMTDDGWYVFAGRTPDGRALEVFRPGPVQERDWSKPLDIPAAVPAERWRKYLSLLENDGQEALRDALLDWMCRDWNGRARPTDRVTQITWWWMVENTPPPGEPEPVPRRVKLATRACAPP